MEGKAELEQVFAERAHLLLGKEEEPCEGHGVAGGEWGGVREAGH